MDKGQDALLIAAVILVILAFAYWAYEKCWLNSMLPANWAKTCQTASGFVGVYAHDYDPYTEPCLTRNRDGSLQYNKCTHV